MPVQAQRDGKRLEAELLRLCSARCMAPAAVEMARECLEREIDWNYVVSEAQRHAVLPLMNQNFQAHFPEMVPKPLLSFLNEAARHCQRRNLAFTGELLRLLTLFEKLEIAAIPFKGPSLAIMAYGNISLRMFADLDILIKEKDLDQARDALLADGYIPKFALTPKQERNYQKSECALQLAHPGRGTVVELHWLLTERYLSINLPIAEFWERSSSARIGQRTIRALAPEDLFLYLCVHGGKHQWERLEWLCGVAEVAVANPDMDCHAIAARARAWGIERMLNLALLLAHNLLAMPLPEALRAGAEGDFAAARLAEQTAAALFSAEPRSVDHSVNRGDLYLYLLRMRERLPDKIRILAYSAVRVPHPSSHEFVRLPSQLAPLYYFLRPARLLGATLWAGFRHIARGRKRARKTKPRSLAEETAITL
jgi:Uncharacterised nucleotidyltransferase